MTLAPLVIAAGIRLTGGLHHDGLMDTADGVAAGRERRLDAMKDSRVGASGVLAFAVVVLLQITALLRLDDAAPLALVLAAFWGRVAPLWAMGRFPYLRADGTAGFHRLHGRPLWDAFPGLIALLGLATAGVPLVVLLAGAPVAVLVSDRLGRRLGGHTGDSYGASLVLTEAFTLLLMAVLHSPR